MSLNDIEITGSLLSALYERVLVETALTPAPKGKGAPKLSGASNEAAGNIRFLGGNLKRYCFVVEYSKEPFLPDAVMETLTKILQACKLSMEDIAIVNVSAADLSIESLRAQLNPEKMVLLGVQPTAIRLPIQFPSYRPQAYAGCVFLLSDALDDMDNSESGRKLKTSLWNCLKEMFAI